MKKLLLSALFGIFILSMSINLDAQQPAYEIAKHTPPPESKKKKNSSSTLIASDGLEFLVADRTKTGQVYSAYDAKTLKVKNTFTLDYPEVNGNEADWVERLFRVEETTTIYGYYNRTTDENTVYGKMTSRTGKDLVKAKVLAKISASKRKNIGNLGKRISKDQSKILLYREVTTDDERQEEIELWLYDDQLEEIYEKKLTFPYKNKQFIIQEYMVTDEGRVIIIAYFRPTKEEVKLNPESKDRKNFMIFGLSPDKEELDEIKIGTDGNIITSAYGWAMDSNTIAFTGYYDEGVERKYSFGSIGLYYVKLNTRAWEINLSHFSKIPKEEIMRILGSNDHSKLEKRNTKKIVDVGVGLRHFVFQGVFPEPDGSVKLISQNEWVEQQCSYSSTKGYTDCRKVFFNAQILEFEMDAQGILTKIVLIPKRQRDSHPMCNGHVSLVSPKKTYFIFNDNDANFTKSWMDNHTDKFYFKFVSLINGYENHDSDKFYYSFYRFGRSRLAYAFTNDNGTADKIALIDNYKKNILILPSESVRIDRTTMISWGKFKRGNELFLMKFYLKPKE